MEEDRSFMDALGRVTAAVSQMGSGDPQPHIDCWAESEEVTLFGAWGPIEKGYGQLVKTFRWVGDRFKGGQLATENAVTFASGDLAYTVGFERGEVVVDGGDPRPMTIRVTHVYRRFGDEWRLVHRHADFPPEDQRQVGRDP
jgi:ketosteroid isomerase-like protein